MSATIVFTGGGTAGHVVPNMAIIEELRQEPWQIVYMGSYDGVERPLIHSINIPYYPVLSGKLRRYFSWKNFFDPYKIVLGIVQSFFLLRRLRAKVVFSKGGFVAFPVVIGAWLNRIPIIAHESDLSPGLANRLSFPFVNKICVTFPAARTHFKKQLKVEVTGTPIRRELIQGSQEKGLALCGFNDKKPCLLVIGGSQGSDLINALVRCSLDTLCNRFQVIHLCGKGKVDANLKRLGYYQLEYANDELAHFFAASDVIVSRAGANTLYEILALSKPHVLLPLSRQSSRGDQIENANYFQALGISLVISEAQPTPDRLIWSIEQAYQQRTEIIEKIKAQQILSATTKIIAIIKDTHAELRNPL
ncbi:MAG: undecaprenyldiphospho-muramoylpentapeptide beta-N-acetylglucosaminyltransferase [Legionella sp.]